MDSIIISLNNLWNAAINKDKLINKILLMVDNLL